MLHSRSRLASIAMFFGISNIYLTLEKVEIVF